MSKPKKYQLFILLVLIFIACESEKRIPPKGYLPVDPVATEELEASYFWISQDKLSSSYWKSAPWVEVELSNKKTGQLYPDGYLNATGTIEGTRDFNKGRNPQFKLKAGYDDEFLYLYVEWKDTTINASYFSRIFDGPEDNEKPDTATGWTSQRSHDNFAILFDNDDKDEVWYWSLAYTAPFDKALSFTMSDDNHQPELEGILVANNVGEDSRDGPLYEWNGERQEILLPDGTRKLLDPAYFLLDDMKIDFEGNAENGRRVFNEVADCKFCHGINGDGDYIGSDGGRLNKVSTLRYTRDGLIEYIADFSHEGSGDQYFRKIANNPELVDDLIAFLRGISGVPGYSLITPETLSEVNAYSNVGISALDSKNSTYKVLLRRRLSTDESDKLSFQLTNNYILQIRIGDNDALNYLGSEDIILKFNSKEL